MRRSRTDKTGLIDRKNKAKKPAARRSSATHASLDAVETNQSRVANSWSRSTFERQSALLGDGRMSHPANAGLKSAVAKNIQRSFGNKYVQRLVENIKENRNASVQTKLSVGPAGDKYEQEADSVAGKVMKGLAADTQSPVQKQEDDAGQAKLQRQGEEEELQMKVQRQDEEELQIKAQREGEEEELQMKVQRQDEEELQMKLQRQGEEEELQMKLQRQEEEELQMAPDEGRIGIEGGSLDQTTESLIEGARSGGTSLPEGLRTSMEGAFGADFSGVRVHSDSKSDELNSKLTSRAFTTGQDIFLKKDEYKPDSSGGKELLAHELTHVVQQKGEEVQRK